MKLTSIEFDQVLADLAVVVEFDGLLRAYREGSVQRPMLMSHMVEELWIQMVPESNNTGYLRAALIELKRRGWMTFGDT